MQKVPKTRKHHGDAVLIGNLDGLGLTATRVEAVRALSRAVDDGSLRLDRGASLDRFVDSVCALRGLGPWSAHYLALRVGEPDAFPIPAAKFSSIPNS